MRSNHGARDIWCPRASHFRSRPGSCSVPAQSPGRRVLAFESPLSLRGILPRAPAFVGLTLLIVQSVKTTLSHVRSAVDYIYCHRKQPARILSGARLGKRRSGQPAQSVHSFLRLSWLNHSIAGRSFCPSLTCWSNRPFKVAFTAVS